MAAGGSFDEGDEIGETGGAAGGDVPEAGESGADDEVEGVEAIGAVEVVLDGIAAPAGEGLAGACGVDEFADGALGVVWVGGDAVEIADAEDGVGEAAGADEGFGFEFGAGVAADGSGSV